ncbi:MAG TPA: DUF4097 family beta strand repeat-containing protein [Candidatus Limnocylindria bacterium]
MATFVRTQSIEHTIGPSGRLDLRVPSADVVVRGTEGGEARLTANFQIRATSDEEADRIFDEVQLRVVKHDAMLVVEDPGDEPSLSRLVGRIFSGHGSVDFDVRVELPHGAELRLDTVSGDVSAEGLDGEQRYNTVSGDLSLTRVGGTLRVNAVSGDITVRAVSPIGIEAQSVSGDLSLIGPMINDLRANTVSGDLEIEGQLAGSGDYRLETVSGDATFGLVGGATFEVRGIASDVSSDLDHRIEGRQDRRRVTVGSGGPTVLFNSMSGDLSINRPRRLDRLVPQPPAAPTPPAPPAPPVSAAPRAEPPSAEEQLAILQALERGEIDVEEASRRLTGAHGDE